jgi:hypothetical protein
MSDPAIQKEKLRQKLFSFDTEFHSYYTQSVKEHFYK